jgi:hypothetical protein
VTHFKILSNYFGRDNKILIGFFYEIEEDLNYLLFPVFLF